MPPTNDMQDDGRPTLAELQASITEADLDDLSRWWGEGTEPDLDWDLATLIPVVSRIRIRAIQAALALNVSGGDA